jgi:hypothetical protein
MSLDQIYQEIQDRLRKQLVVIVGTGSSMAVDYNFGMNALELHLKKEIPLQIAKNSKAIREWKKVTQNRKHGHDFENSLNGVTSQFLLDRIISETGNHVAKINHKNISKVTSGNIPIKILFERLKNTLSYVNPIIDIITPNYDLLLENALSHCNIDYNDGFYGGLQQKFDWLESEQLFNRIERDNKTKKIYTKIKPHFRLHKVHGSLNYFVYNDAVIKDDSLSYLEKFDNLDRFIITPGDSKHKRIVENRNFYREMDNAIDKAQTYLFVGYGFNDIDIDKKICQNINQASRKAIIITKDLTGNAPTFLNDNPNIIAIYDNNLGGSTIRYDNDIHELKTQIWQIDEFAKEIL